MLQQEITEQLRVRGALSSNEFFYCTRAKLEIGQSDMSGRRRPRTLSLTGIVTDSEPPEASLLENYTAAPGCAWTIGNMNMRMESHARHAMRGAMYFEQRPERTLELIIVEHPDESEQALLNLQRQLQRNLRNATVATPVGPRPLVTTVNLASEVYEDGVDWGIDTPGEERPKPKRRKPAAVKEKPVRKGRVIICD
jgi:hypothetical protein